MTDKTLVPTWRRIGTPNSTVIIWDGSLSNDICGFGNITRQD